MNINVKAMWLDRLRNGGIQQGKGKLGTTDGKRCCLGVLCDIAVEHGVIPAPTQLGGTHNVLVYDALDRNYLPKSVQEWAGLNAHNPSVVVGDEDGRSVHLADLNDNGTPFERIADLIEESL